MDQGPQHAQSLVGRAVLAVVLSIGFASCAQLRIADIPFESLVA